MRAVRTILKKIKEFGDRVSRVHHFDVHLAENITVVSNSVAEDAEFSILRYGLWTFLMAPFHALYKDLQLHP